MDILIPDNWLRDYLKTKADAKDIAQYLSLCGPSVEKIEKTKYGPVYSIEVTTNRVDSASIYGIAREAHAILPRFGIKTILQPIKQAKLKLVKKVKYLNAQVDFNLCPRFTAVLIRNTKIGPSPKWMQERLLAVGERPINNIVDISNYLMHELGQPMHTFDYDKIKGAKMILRASRKGEEVITLDTKKHSLPEDVMVIEDGEGRLIDLAGIMGGALSAVDEQTKNVLLFVQNYNPVNIRRASMKLAHRTEAAVLFEKGVDPELVSLGMQEAIELFVKLTGGKAEKEILDLYPNSYKEKVIKISKEFIQERLGIEIKNQEIVKFLESLGFKVSNKKDNFEIKVPSFRSGDVSIPEDIVEEVARIYGYHNLPSKIMTGEIPNPLVNSPFNFEQKIKYLIKGLGGVEVYTLSLVSEKETTSNSLKLRNPLGKDSEFLRTSLLPSLSKAASENLGLKEKFQLFEMANIYLPRKNDLPEERLILGGIFSDHSYREAKGMVETILNSLNIKYQEIPEDTAYFMPSQRIVYKADGQKIGEVGILEKNNFIYYEFEVEKIRKLGAWIKSYNPIPKYPAQIENLTFTLPEKTKVGEVISLVDKIDKLIFKFELKDIYKNAYTFKIWYQHPTKTLTDQEVEKLREKIISEVSKKFGATFKG